MRPQDMILFVSLLLLSGEVCGSPTKRLTRQVTNEIPIINFVNENNYDGSYRYSYETGNGISVEEEGFLKNAGQGEEAEAQSAKGSFSYTAPDGQLIRVTWYADETGFHAEGDHIPKEPAGPQAAFPGQSGLPGPIEITPVAGFSPRG